MEQFGTINYLKNIKCTDTHELQLELMLCCTCYNDNNKMLQWVSFFFWWRRRFSGNRRKGLFFFICGEFINRLRVQITKTLFCIIWGVNQFNLALRCAGSVLFHSSVCIWLTLRMVLRYASCLCLQILLRARKARTRLVSSPVLHCFSSCYTKQKDRKSHALRTILVI